MMKELIGGVTTFLVMLPFLLLNRYIFRINNHKKFILFFLIVNIIQGAFLFLLAYGLFVFGQNTLFGMLIVFTIFLFLNLLLLIMSKRKLSIINFYEGEDGEDEDSDLYDEELFEDQRIARTQEVKSNIKKEIDDLSNDQILEENHLTKKVDDIDFDSLDKSEINKMLEDIFKE
ncbi:MAG: hypothetical protein FD141_445 [Fusobacteria bacterium]|nr:MAG: hypothetical protein FD141_445 [Fusobacteriota bacterium]KAF0228890.1 MAG: hypothetical protein FD182_1146 [Fusobacteriota bacterium]